MVWITLFFLLQKTPQNLRAVFNIEGLFEAVESNIRFAHPLSTEEFDLKYHKVDFLYNNLNSTKPLDPLEYTWSCEICMCISVYGAGRKGCLFGLICAVLNLCLLRWQWTIQTILVCCPENLHLFLNWQTYLSDFILSANKTGLN